jgi:hypothetical protein
MPTGLLLAPGRLERVRAAVRRGRLPVRRSLVDGLVQEQFRVRSREHVAPAVPAAERPTTLPGHRVPIEPAR